MSGDTRVQAALTKVSPERFGALQLLGIKADQFDLFKNFEVAQLTEMASFGLDLEELLAAVQHPGYGFYNIGIYAHLRKRGIEPIEIVTLGTRGADEMMKGIEVGFSIEQARLAVANGLKIRDALDAENAGISFDDILEAQRARAHSASDYIKAILLGCTHSQLIQVLKLTASDPRSFTLENYTDIRARNITHRQIMKVLRAKQIDTYGRFHYIEYVLDDKRALSHDQAFELIEAGVSPRFYWAARRPSTHEQVMEAVHLGITGGDLEKYGVFLANNCRITHEEVLQYAQLSDHLYLDGINSYIKLVDAGFTFEEVLAGYKAGVSCSYYGLLRLEPLSLTQAELLEVAQSGIKCGTYHTLREEGIAHATIIENVHSMDVA